jgi:hypothetical protein
MDSNQENSPLLIDEITNTLAELNKAVQNITYIAETSKSLDLVNTFKSLSGKNVKHLFKDIDIKQITDILQSPEVRQMLTDPDFYALLSPDTGTTPGTQPNINPYEDTQEQEDVQGQEGHS